MVSGSISAPLGCNLVKCGLIAAKVGGDACGLAVNKDDFAGLGDGVAEGESSVLSCQFSVRAEGHVAFTDD